MAESKFEFLAKKDGKVDFKINDDVKEPEAPKPPEKKKGKNPFKNFLRGKKKVETVAKEIVEPEVPTKPEEVESVEEVKESIDYDESKEPDHTQEEYEEFLKFKQMKKDYAAAAESETEEFEPEDEVTPDPIVEPVQPEKPKTLNIVIHLYGLPDITINFEASAFEELNKILIQNIRLGNVIKLGDQAVDCTRITFWEFGE